MVATCYKTSNKSKQGYQKIDDRPKCKVCKHAIFRENGVIGTCDIGGFQISNLGICNRYEPANESELKVIQNTTPHKLSNKHNEVLELLNSRFDKAINNLDSVFNKING